MGSAGSVRLACSRVPSFLVIPEIDKGNFKNQNGDGLLCLRIPKGFCGNRGQGDAAPVCGAWVWGLNPRACQRRPGLFRAPATLSRWRTIARNWDKVSLPEILKATDRRRVTQAVCYHEVGGGSKTPLVEVYKTGLEQPVRSL